MAKIIYMPLADEGTEVWRRFADNSEGLAAVVLAAGARLTFNEWVKERAARIAELGLMAAEEHRADWIKLQIEITLMQALRHGRSGLGDDDPVTP